MTPQPESGPSQVCLIPLIGGFHLRSPAYNAVTVRDVTVAFAPDALALTALAAGAFDDGRWRDTPEIALPLALVPWAEGAGVPLHPLSEPSPDERAEADFVRYLQQYDSGRETLREIEAAREPLRAVLERALGLQDIESELLPALSAYQARKREAFGDGPGTDWLDARCRAMAERIVEISGRVAVLAPIDQLPGLREQLSGRVRLIDPPQVAQSEAARIRSLLDFAMRIEVPEPGNVLAQLRNIDSPEARYHEANLLLANGHPAEALERLEIASRGDFSAPYFLPGYLLARLGQLRDLAGDREAALRAYRGVRALDYAPVDALEAAEAGLRAPFRFEAGDPAETLPPE